MTQSSRVLAAPGAPATATPVDPQLPRGTLYRYGVGQTGAQIFRDTPAALLPVFMTTILGIPAWMAGIAILVPKLWVIVCDPLIGAWSDRTAATRGRTPFLVFGAIFTSLGFYALFALPDFASPTLTAMLVSFVFLLSMTAFSAFSVPYLGIAATLSDDTHERTRILVYRMVFVSLGVILGIGIAQPMVFWFGGGHGGWHAMGVVFGLICLVSMLGSAIGLRPVLAERSLPVMTMPPLRQQFMTAMRNRPFRLCLLIHFVQTVGQASSYTAVALVFIYLVGNVGLLLPFVIVMTLSGLAAQPLWMKISRSRGKVPLFIWLVIGWCAVTLSWLAIDFGADMPLSLPLLGDTSVKELLILLRGVLIGWTNVGFLLMLTSLFTDTIYLGEEPGGAMEGSYAGIWSAAEKLAFAMGPVIGGATLSLFGFASSRGGIVDQSDSALLGVLMTYSVIPIAFFLLSLVFVPSFSRSLAARAGRPAA